MITAESLDARRAWTRDCVRRQLFVGRLVDAWLHGEDLAVDAPFTWNGSMSNVWDAAEEAINAAIRQRIPAVELPVGLVDVLDDGTISGDWRADWQRLLDGDMSVSRKVSTTSSGF